MVSWGVTLLPDRGWESVGVCVAMSLFIGLCYWQSLTAQADRHMLGRFSTVRSSWYLEQWVTLVLSCKWSSFHSKTNITKQGIEVLHWAPPSARLPPCCYLRRNVYKLDHKVVTCFPFQLNSENQPTDQLDGLALSILREIGSTATTGNVSCHVKLALY